MMLSETWALYVAHTHKLALAHSVDSTESDFRQFCSKISYPAPSFKRAATVSSEAQRLPFDDSRLLVEANQGSIAADTGKHVLQHLH
jgi:hypothetical protein